MGDRLNPVIGRVAPVLWIKSLMLMKGTGYILPLDQVWFSLHSSDNNPYRFIHEYFIYMKTAKLLGVKWHQGKYVWSKEEQELPHWHEGTFLEKQWVILLKKKICKGRVSICIGRFIWNSFNYERNITWSYGKPTS